MRKILVVCAGVGAMLGGNLSCGGNPVEAQQGPQGPAGKDGVSGYEVVKLTQSLLPGGATPIVVSCPAGKTAVGSGYLTDNANIPVMNSAPGTTKADWAFLFRNNSGSAAPVTAYALCVIAN